MQSIAYQIENKIITGNRGKIYFPPDFVAIGSSEAVKKTLLRLETSGLLKRIAHGIYLYPEIDDKYGMGILYPSTEEIAREIAARDHVRIAPSGAFALNALGLSDQVPVNAVFLTDGAPRKIKIYNRNLVFIHTAPKNLSYKSRILMLIVSALKEINPQNMTPCEREKIKHLLSQEKKENLLSDLDLVPERLRKVLLPLIGQTSWNG